MPKTAAAKQTRRDQAVVIAGLAFLAGMFFWWTQTADPIETSSPVVEACRVHALVRVPDPAPRFTGISEEFLPGGAIVEGVIEYDSFGTTERAPFKCTVSIDGLDIDVVRLTGNF